MFKVIYEEWFRDKNGDWDYHVKEKLCTCRTEAEFILNKLNMDQFYRYENIKIIELKEHSTVLT